MRPPRAPAPPRDIMSAAARFHPCDHVRGVRKSAGEVSWPAGPRSVRFGGVIRSTAAICFMRHPTTKAQYSVGLCDRQKDWHALGWAAGVRTTTAAWEGVERQDKSWTKNDGEATFLSHGPRREVQAGDVIDKRHRGLASLLACALINVSPWYQTSAQPHVRLSRDLRHVHLELRPSIFPTSHLRYQLQPREPTSQRRIRRRKRNHVSYASPHSPTAKMKLVR